MYANENYFTDKLCVNLKLKQNKYYYYYCIT